MNGLLPDHDRSSPVTIDNLLPSFRYRISAETGIDASPPTVWSELVGIPMSALPLGFALTRLRHFPDVLAGNETPVAGTDTFFDATPIPVVVRVKQSLIISAGPSQAWKILGGDHPPDLDARQFSGWQEPGWIKVAMQFRLTEFDGGQKTLLSTETRITSTDDRTARLFAPYWWAIRAGSVLIRREVVAQVRKRAENH